MSQRGTAATGSPSATGADMDLKHHIRGIPDFPKPGILFYDISTLIGHPEAWRHTIERMAERIRPFAPERLVAIESRGFLTAAPLAYMLGCGFVMVRKKGKLPGQVIPHSYDLEYGSDTIEIQADGVGAGQRVVVLDDLLATGGTLSATVSLLRKMGADVAGAGCIIELTFLDGRSRLDVPLETLVAYES